jgi:hypothetical protein
MIAVRKTDEPPHGYRRGQFNMPVRVIAFGTNEGWARDLPNRCLLSGLEQTSRK